MCSLHLHHILKTGSLAASLPCNSRDPPNEANGTEHAAWKEGFQWHQRQQYYHHYHHHHQHHHHSHHHSHLHSHTHHHHLHLHQRPKRKCPLVSPTACCCCYILLFFLHHHCDVIRLPSVVVYILKRTDVSGGGGGHGDLARGPGRPAWGSQTQRLWGIYLVV